uniref:Uncharacterized protein n=1 Tax=Dulem virus 71 TaxID=3145782 RepID=A0AAU8AXG5_9VIRU
MQAIIDGFNWIIDFFKTIFSFITNTFTTIGMAFQYIATIVELCYKTIADLPNYLQAFGLITISICAIYLVINRPSGRSKE